MPEPGAWTTWWPYNGGMVGLHFTEIAGRAELVGVEVWSGGPPAGVPGANRPGAGGALSAVALRGLPIGRFASEARRQQARMAGLMRELYDPGQHPSIDPAQLDQAIRAFAARRGRGGLPPVYGPEHYARVSAVYTAAWRGGSHPTKAVAAWGVVESSTAAKWVARARSLGLLAATTKGKAVAGLPGA
jgi:hypothetical protein